MKNSTSLAKLSVVGGDDNEMMKQQLTELEVLNAALKERVDQL